MIYSIDELIKNLQKVDSRFGKNIKCYDGYEGADYYIRVNLHDGYRTRILAKFSEDTWEINDQGDIPTDLYFKGLKVVSEFMLEIEGRRKVVVPLPRLSTKDGKRLYLSYEDSYFYPAIRDKSLNQEWEKKDIVKIPKEYRPYILEIE